MTARLPRQLSLLACAIAVVGAVLVQQQAPQHAEPLSVDSILDALRAAASAAFSGPWELLAQAVAAASAIMVLLALVDRLLSARRSATVVPASTGIDLKAVLDRTRGHVADCSTDPSNVIQLFEEVVRGAVAARASDIHISPSHRTVAITYRVDGTVHELTKLPIAFSPSLSIRAKVLARLDTQGRTGAQDGRIAFEIDGSRVEMRLSCLPTETGERMALRLVHGSRTTSELDGLGLNPQILHSLQQLLARPQGMLFVTGPVGSGKTTTLYAALQHIATQRGSNTSIVTLEDPIEIELPFATQTQMNARTGMTFAAMLRSVLRQDPNVLMVGEIRDQETATVAAQASLTGHLILTSVHSDSAAGPFARLIELQVEPFVLASATLGSLSQRLVRTLCKDCRREQAPAKSAYEAFAKSNITLPPARYFEAVGCERCDGSGFTGRLPIAELLVVDAELREAIHERTPSNELYALAQKRGMSTLLQSGLKRAVAGETSISEVLRVVS